ncbi:MAG: chemotaxis protein CheB [Comamonadaceae bacterium]|nr:MAG: chemotaxis protein CheB [Comamonadaceae bacterium]
MRTLPADFSRPATALAIGASAGGVEALLHLLADLPRDFALPVIVVLHVSDERTSLLPEVFGYRLALPVREASDKQAIEPGTVYFAPPGYHLLVENDLSFSLSCDPREHYSRPSIDVMMDSAADAWGEGLAGVLLTGANEDGAAGLSCVGKAGGLTVVQDPAEAQVSTMPQAAIDLKSPDFVLSLKDIKTLIARLSPAPQ